MAEVVAQCASREVRTPTQYVARWTEVLAVARERGHLAEGHTELSFDVAADVDAARPALVEAVCGAVAAEEGCGPEPARERVRQLVEGLDRPRPKRGSGGRGKRREAAPARRLSEVRDGETIPHELRWNRCAELAASLELTVIEASLLMVVAMYSVTRAFVCWETRAGLMALARIKTNASFAAAVATLTRLGLLVPVDGAPRTAWHLGESFWGGPAGRRGTRHAGVEAGAGPASGGGTAGGSAPSGTAGRRSRRPKGTWRRRLRSRRSAVEVFRRCAIPRQARIGGAGIQWCRKPNQ